MKSNSFIKTQIPLGVLVTLYRGLKFPERVVPYYQKFRHDDPIIVAGLPNVDKCWFIKKEVAIYSPPPQIQNKFSRFRQF